MEKLLKLISLLILLFGISVTIYSQECYTGNFIGDTDITQDLRQSKNGCYLTAHGNIRVLMIFFELN
jgi:hypothetical protein